MRNDPWRTELYQPFIYVGQSAEQMIKTVNKLITEKKPVCTQLIISGGIKNYLDGYYLTSLSQLPAVYGMASSVLKYAAADDRGVLKTYLEDQVIAYRFAQAYLRLNPAYEGK